MHSSFADAIEQDEIAECTACRGLSRDLFAELMEIVQSSTIDGSRLRLLTARAEEEFSSLRQRVVSDPKPYEPALRLSEAKAELTVAFLLLRQAPGLSTVDRKFISRHLNAAFRCDDLLPHPKYRFTTDWVTRYARRWSEHFSTLVGRPDLRFLEVGSFEGRSACWWLDNVLTHYGSSITCIDPFIGHQAQELLFDFNIAASGGQSRVSKIKAFSSDALPRLTRGAFDLVYLDGSHFAIDVAQDALLSWPLLRAGGLCLIDDYAIDRKYPETSNVRWARRGVDAFLSIVEGSYELLHKEYQLLVRKKQ